MKIKNGFTFSEMLVVIALIGVIFLIAYPSVLLITKRINERLYNTKIDIILSTAEMYAQDVDPTDIIEVDVDFLLKEEYLTPDEEKQDECAKEGYLYGCIVNPIYTEGENEKFLNNLKVKITPGNGGTYNAMLEGEEDE